MTNTPFWRRMMSASGVVGPLAISARMRGRTRAAFSRGDLALERRGREDVDRQLEERRVADRLRAREAHDGAVLRLPGAHGAHVEPVAAGDAADRVADGDDAGADLLEQRRRRRAGVAEALDGDGRAVDVEPDVARCLDDRHDRAAAGGLDAALGPAQADRLAGDDAGHGVPDVHRVGVHHPGHHLGVRVHVRRRDVLLRAR